NQTHGIGTLESLQVGGKDVEGTLFPTGPGVVAKGLPDTNPVKKVASEFTVKYEAKYGANSATQFAGDAWGAYTVLDNSVMQVLQLSSHLCTAAFCSGFSSAFGFAIALILPNGMLNVSAKDH